MKKIVWIDQLQLFQLWYTELWYSLAAFLYISAIYISITFAICGFSLLIQMITVNIHHVRPIRAVPKWIQTINNCLPFHCASRKYQVDPETKEKSQIDDEQPATSSQNTSRQAGDKVTIPADPVLLDEIRVWREKVKSDDENSALSEEWKIVAHHLNNFFLILFIVVQVIIALLCFAILPNVG